MKRNMGALEGASASTDTKMALSDENSLWGADVYIEVTKDIPEANMSAISGTFLSRVLEGPYHDMRKWIKEMKAFVQSKS